MSQSRTQPQLGRDGSRLKVDVDRLDRRLKARLDAAEARLDVLEQYFTDLRPWFEAVEASVLTGILPSQPVF